MIEQLWKLFIKSVSGKRAKEFGTAIWQEDRWFSDDRYARTIDWYLNKMNELGLKEVEGVDLPADGKTSFGGVVMPKLWTAKEATLKLLSPVEAEIADYHKVPCGLMLYSSATPKEGEVFTITEEGQISKDKALFGRISPQQGHEMILRGGVRILISDFLTREEGAKEDAVQWHNFTVNPFYSKDALGFAICASWAEKLRRLLAQGKELTFLATSDTQTQEGVVALPTGVIPGLTTEEVIITGHLYEQGMDDNACGCGLGLEVMGVIADLIAQGILPVPRRTIRLLPSYECRGVQTYSNLYAQREALAGIGLDEVASEKSYAISLFKTPYANPSATDYLLAHLLRKACHNFGRPEYQTKPFSVNDGLLSDPMIGTPTPWLGTLGSNKPYYHNSLDGPDVASTETLTMVGTMAATYVYFLANASSEQARWWTKITVEQLKKESPSPFRLGKIMDSFLPFVPAEERTAFKHYLKTSCQSVPTSLAGFDQPATSVRKEAESIRPQRHFRGLVGFDDLSSERFEDYCDTFGEPPWWISADWLNEVLFLADGQRTLYEIYQILSQEELKLDLEKTLKYVLFLHRTGKLSFRSKDHGTD